MPLSPEHHAQKALFKWAALAAGQDPRLRLLYAIPNGGHRIKAVAAKLKAEGVKAGVPDICLPIPLNYMGLYLELKVGPNQPIAAQRRWLLDLQALGYAAVVAYGWEAARWIIEQYLAAEWSRHDIALGAIADHGQARRSILTEVRIAIDGLPLCFSRDRDPVPTTPTPLP